MSSYPRDALLRSPPEIPLMAKTPPTGVSWQSYNPRIFIKNFTLSFLPVSSNLVLILAANSKSSFGVLASHKASSCSTKAPKLLKSFLSKLSPLACNVELSENFVFELFENL